MGSRFSTWFWLSIPNRLTNEYNATVQMVDKLSTAKLSISENVRISRHSERQFDREPLADAHSQEGYDFSAGSTFFLLHSRAFCTVSLKNFSFSPFLPWYCGAR